MTIPKKIADTCRCRLIDTSLFATNKPSQFKVYECKVMRPLVIASNIGYSTLQNCKLRIASGLFAPLVWNMEKLLVWKVYCIQ